jgi:hypothetical protein
VHITSQLPTLALLCPKKQPVLPNEWGLGGPLGWPGHIWRKLFTPVRYQNLHHEACMQPGHILFQTPNTDRRTSKSIYAKYGLQLGITLDKLNTGYICSPWALYKHSSQQAQWHGNFQVTTKTWTKFFLQQSLPCDHHPWPFRLQNDSFCHLCYCSSIWAPSL